ncbi:MAG: BrnA antitoxin family protein [Ruminococcus sp.]|nr:BrnA antitoxin family protein [Ruminococcus sp.]
MREEYNIEELNPRKNPYAKKLRQQITINIDCNVVDFFKQMSANCGIPYQTLINLYLSDCMNQNRKIDISWT